MRVGAFCADFLAADFLAADFFAVLLRAVLLLAVLPDEELDAFSAVLFFARPPAFFSAVPSDRDERLPLVSFLS